MCYNFLCKESARNLHSRLSYAKQKVLQENIPYNALNRSLYNCLTSPGAKAGKCKANSSSHRLRDQPAVFLS